MATRRKHRVTAKRHAKGRDPLAGTPELALFEKWRALSKRAAKGDRKAYALVDKIQYELQDMSALGNSLVFGHEGRQRD
jgi:hypothetical protein